MPYRYLTAWVRRMAARAAAVAPFATQRTANLCRLSSVMVRVGDESVNFPNASSIAPAHPANSAPKVAAKNKNSHSQAWIATWARATGMTSPRKMIGSGRQCSASACGTALLRPASTTLWAESSISRTMSGTLPEFGLKTDQLHNLPRGCRDLPAQVHARLRRAHSTQLPPVHEDGAAQSARSTLVGLTRVARRAGARLATRATTTNSTGTVR
jgi:hypothetical protein